MKRLSLIFTFVLISVFIFSTFVSQPVSSASPKGTIRVMVTYKGGQKAAVKRTLQDAGAKIHYAFDDLQTFALTVPVAALNGISRNPNVVLVEEDPLRYLIGNPLPLLNAQAAVRAAADTTDPNGQTIPFGLDMVQARDLWDVNRDGVIDVGAHTGAGKKVCIIDSGLYTAHEDFSGVDVTGGWPTTGTNPWNDDGLGHGTHVAGTIAAMNNTVGVVGVTPGTVSLFIVRVFGDTGSWVNASSLVAAANVCRDNGANIISMSLSGPTSSNPERRAFDGYYNTNGILSVAAASNDGTTAFAYPASYNSVISVAAVDSDAVYADFSNYNSQVELAAPGVNVTSTVPFLETNTVTVGGVSYKGSHIEFSARGSTSGALSNGGICDSVGAWTGRVVLCQRGTNSFYEKVMNVQNGGGRAALIYNNVSGGFQGTLGEGNSSTIIALGLSLEDGQYLAANNIGSTATVSSSVVTPASGYEAWSGTSMATPHVSAAAALVWSCLPTATNVQVRNALTSTALDLGTAGRDVHYGYGLVQAKNACFSLNPTAVELKSFTAVGSQKSVTLRWETVSESDNLGFNLYRSRAVDGKKTKVNRELIPTQTYPGSSIGASYKFWDRPLIPQMTYFYWLEDVDIYGRTELHGPIKVKTLQLKK